MTRPDHMERPDLYFRTCDACGRDAQAWVFDQAQTLKRALCNRCVKAEVRFQDEVFGRRYRLAKEQPKTQGALFAIN